MNRGLQSKKKQPLAWSRKVHNPPPIDAATGENGPNPLRVALKRKKKEKKKARLAERSKVWWWGGGGPRALQDLIKDAPPPQEAIHRWRCSCSQAPGPPSSTRNKARSKQPFSALSVLDLKANVKGGFFKLLTRFGHRVEQTRRPRFPISWRDLNYKDVDPTTDSLIEIWTESEGASWLG